MPSLPLRLLLRRFALLLGVYVLLRAGFYAFNYETFQEASAGQIALAFWHGFRFDISALLLLNLPFVTLSMVPALGRRWQRLLWGLYLLLNALGIALNIVDWEYFKFIGRRTSNELTTIGADVQRQAGQLVGNYWFLILPFLLLLVALWYFYPMPEIKQPEGDGIATSTFRSQASRRWLQLLEALLVIGFTVLGIRGGLQLKPLRTGAAFAQQPATLGHLALNSTFTFLKSLGYENLEHRRYFDSEADLQQALAASPALKSPAPAPRRDNVVVLLLESFASEYTGVENGGHGGYTPFFDSLATHGGGFFGSIMPMAGVLLKRCRPCWRDYRPCWKARSSPPTFKPMSCTGWAKSSAGRAIPRPYFTGPKTALWALIRLPGWLEYSATTA
ncbi:hypothetical protein PK28_07990 [Hymenobacter sp. DG25B]|nr:hypothetical protein PK28_07990 [Hymenobacter sp. DG25B]